MLARTGDSFCAADRFGETLSRFHEHAQAIASGQAEGDAFTWFLATEYQWEMEMACTWLVESPDSQLTDAEKDTMRHFLKTLPEIRTALTAGRRAASHRNQAASSPEWTEWLEIAALPSWNDFTVRTAILLSRLGQPAQNDTAF
ncbi:MAG TPA: hypothetical protein VIL60_06865 [Rhodanobacter sp.]